MEFDVVFLVGVGIRRVEGDGHGVGDADDVHTAFLAQHVEAGLDGLPFVVHFDVALAEAEILDICLPAFAADLFPDEWLGPVQGIQDQRLEAVLALDEGIHGIPHVIYRAGDLRERRNVERPGAVFGAEQDGGRPGGGEGCFADARHAVDHDLLRGKLFAAHDGFQGKRGRIEAESLFNILDLLLHRRIAGLLQKRRCLCHGSILLRGR